MHTTHMHTTHTCTQHTHAHNTHVHTTHMHTTHIHTTHTYTHMCTHTFSQQKTRKSKVKELVFSSVVDKGGGLLRVYTALVSIFHRRMVVVCGKRTTVGDVVQTVLAKCDKHGADPKRFVRLMMWEGEVVRG